MKRVIEIACMTEYVLKNKKLRQQSFTQDSKMDQNPELGECDQDNINTASEFLIIENPLLTPFYSSISLLLKQISQKDSSISFKESIIGIMLETLKAMKNDPNAPPIAVISANWTQLSNQIISKVNQINHQNQSTKLLDLLNSIHNTIETVNNSPPLAQAAKKEHHNIYLGIQKSLSLMDQSTSMKDRLSILLRKFKNDLSHSYSKFFSMSRLDRASVLTAQHDCRNFVDQILRILAGTNQMIVVPNEFQSFLRFINDLEPKIERKNQSKRAKTPPSKIPKSISSFNKSKSVQLNQNSAPISAIPKTPNTIKAKNPKQKQNVRSKTPPSKLTRQPRKNSNIRKPSKPSQLIRTQELKIKPNQINSKVSPNQEKVLVRNKKPKQMDESKSQDMLYTNESAQQPKMNNESTNRTPEIRSPPKKRLNETTSNKRLNNVHQINETTSNKKLNDVHQISEKPKKLMKESSSFSKFPNQKSKANSNIQRKEIIKKDKIQLNAPSTKRDSDDIDEQLIQIISKENNNLKNRKTALLYQEGSRILPRENELTNSVIETQYKTFLERLRPFDQLISIKESIERFKEDLVKKTSHSKNDFLSISDQNLMSVENELSKINELIAINQLNKMSTFSDGSFEFNTLLLKIGQLLSQFNLEIEEMNSVDNSDESQFTSLFEEIEEKILKLNDSKFRSLQSQFQSAKPNVVSYLEKHARSRIEKVLRKSNKAIQGEIDRLSIELTQMKTNKKTVNFTFDDFSTEDELVKKLSRMPNHELIAVREEAEAKLNMMKTENDNLIQVLKRESLVRQKTRIDIRQELANVAEQIAQAHKCLSTSSKSKIIEYQSQIFTREQMQTILSNLFAKESQLIQALSSS